MEPGASMEPTQKEKARDAAIELTAAIKRALKEGVKFQGCSERTFASLASQMLKICEAEVTRTEEQHVLQGTGNDREIHESPADAERQKLGRNFSFLDLKPPAVESGGSGVVYRLPFAITDSGYEMSSAAMESGGSSFGYGYSGSKISSATIAHPWTRKDELGKVRIRPKWSRTKLLGRGGFGEVWAAVDNNGFEFAVKQAPRVRENAGIEKEVEILEKLDHGNIVKFYDWEKDEHNIYMFIELMAGSIRDEMNRTKSPVPNDKAVKYTRDVLQGLIYLHSKDVVHRDIKCANILLDEEGVAKLADMGLSKYHYHTTDIELSEHRAGTKRWMSPEVIKGKQAGKRSDVWSVGCTVYEMVKERPPFAGPDVTIEQLEDKIKNLRHKNLVRSDEYMERTLKKFLLKIFVEIKDRPYAKDIAKHSWLQ